MVLLTLLALARPSAAAPLPVFESATYFGGAGNESGAALAISGSDLYVVGDVWLCGGQSNMEDVVENVYHGDTEVASANHAAIRLLTIPVNAVPKSSREFPRINEYNAWTKRYE